MDNQSLHLLEDGLRKTMTALSGRELDEALTELGWLEMLDEMPDAAISLVFRLLGETGAHAPVLNDVLLRAAGREGGGGEVVPVRPFPRERREQPAGACPPGVDHHLTGHDRVRVAVQLAAGDPGDLGQA